MKERLTERDEYGNADIIGCESELLCGDLDFKQMNCLTKALNRLAEYEDLEEQGLLVRLTTTLNKPVYIIMGDKSIKEMTVFEYYIAPNGIFARLGWMDGRHNMRMTVPVKELNNCYAEAEKKLAELKGEK